MTTSPSEQIPIRTLCSLTGVNAMTLRAWERRYGLIRPLRTPKGHRLYTHDHVALVRRVLALIDRGVPISRVGEALDASSASHEKPRGRGPWREHLDRMTAAITRFDEVELDRIYDEALSLHRIEQVTGRLLMPLLASLGERWRDLPGGIAEEHFFATYLRNKLGARLHHRDRRRDGPRLLAACAPGDQHEIGLLLFAVEAHAAGFRLVLLGANTPFEEIAIAQRRASCDAVVISSSIDPEIKPFAAALRSLVQQSGVPVFFGGPTAVQHRQAIAATGAVPLGTEIENGIRLIGVTLKRAATAG